MATFLAHYLKDQGAPPASEALTFRTGANEWTQHDAWPPVKNVDAAAPVFPGRRQARPSPSRRRRRTDGVRHLSLGSAEPGALSPAADHARHAAGRPGWSKISGSCTDVPTCAPTSTDPLTEAGRRLGTDRRAPVRRHQRHRQRLGRQADRRLSREVRGRDDARVPADDRRRRDPRPVSQEHRTARRADAERSRRVRDSVPRQRSRVPSRAPHHGAGAEHLVPGDRSEPAEVRAEHLSRAAVRLHRGHPAHLPIRRARVTHRAAGRRSNTENFLWENTSAA